MPSSPEIGKWLERQLYRIGRRYALRYAESGRVRAKSSRWIDNRAFWQAAVDVARERGGGEVRLGRGTTTLDQQEEDEEGARKQLEWMEYMDKLAQEELGARPRSDVIVRLEDE